jgi:hypothetical protein
MSVAACLLRPDSWMERLSPQSLPGDPATLPLDQRRAKAGSGSRCRLMRRRLKLFSGLRRRYRRPRDNTYAAHVPHTCRRHSGVRKCCTTDDAARRQTSHMVESRMGAVAWGLWPSPRFPSPLISRVEDWRAGRPFDRATFPVPSTSHAACGFPALRAPICFTPTLMGPILLGQLSARRVALCRR